MTRQRCAFTWKSRDGRWHACTRMHDPATLTPLHRCSDGHSICPGRVHPPDHSRKVEELARARNRRSLAGASLKYLRWSTADDIRVVELRASGMPLELVAAEVGRTWAAVKSRLQKLAKQERSV